MTNLFAQLDSDDDDVGVGRIHRDVSFAHEACDTIKARKERQGCSTKMLAVPKSVGILDNGCEEVTVRDTHSGRGSRPFKKVKPAAKHNTTIVDPPETTGSMTTTRPAPPGRPPGERGGALESFGFACEDVVHSFPTFFFVGMPTRGPCSGNRNKNIHRPGAHCGREWVTLVVKLLGSGTQHNKQFVCPVRFRNKPVRIRDSRLVIINTVSRVSLVLGCVLLHLAYAPPSGLIEMNRDTRSSLQHSQALRCIRDNLMPRTLNWDSGSALLH